MRMYDIILKKKRNGELSEDEIKFFVDGLTNGSIPDSQISALCMAICFCGMNENETSALTRCMTYSGDTIDLSSLENTVDKHSTGGVGDKTTLVVAPLCASLGLSVAKMSGRGLGHTGGTIDKLEAIPGYRTSLSEDEFLSQVKKIGVSVISQTGNLTPADKKLYALRDITATVDSIPLIVSSIMSKKLAAGAKNIVLDVKYGSGAFMKTPEDAMVLAEEMVKTGKANGRRISALITAMESPLGRCVGNSLEVMEAVKILRGEEKGELYELCVLLGAKMYSLAMNKGDTEAVSCARYALDSGKAYMKLLEWVSAQGGDIRCIENNSLPVGKERRELFAMRDGYISRIDAELTGKSACLLGSGRTNKADMIDMGAGIVFGAEVGQRIHKGEHIATLYSSDRSKLDEAEKALTGAIEYSDNEVKKLPLIYGII